MRDFYYSFTQKQGFGENNKSIISKILLFCKYKYACCPYQILGPKKNT